MRTIQVGNPVRARSAFGEYLDRIALSGVEMGHSFQVVWVCAPEEWEAAQEEDREPSGVPWPAEDVQLAEEAAEGARA